MSEMALTADHLIVIGQGKLLADLSMNEFIDQNSHSFVRLRTPQPEQLLDLLAANGMTATPDSDGAFEVVDADPARIGDLVAAHGVTLHELSPQRASLEEAFMRMTADSVEYHTGAVPTHGLTGELPPGETPAPTPASAPAPAAAWGADWRNTKGNKKKES
jgi:ABC-2 type transport system ATP-binding protein